MEKRTHQRIRSGTSKKISGSTSGRKLGYNTVIHNKTSKPTKPKYRSYNEVVLHKETIEMMFAIANSEGEYGGALDYDPISKHPSVIKIERGEESSVYQVVKFKDTDYEILFHTHPTRPLSSFWNGPSPADIWWAIAGAKETNYSRNKEFLIEDDDFYIYGINDSNDYKRIKKLIKKARPIIRSQNRERYKNRELDKIVGTTDESVFEYILTALYNDNFYAKIPNKDKKKFVQYNTIKNKYKRRKKLDIKTLPKKEQKIIIAGQKLVLKTNEQFWEDVYETTGVSVDRKHKPSIIKTGLKVQHNPKRRGRTNPKKRKKQISEILKQNKKVKHSNLSAIERKMVLSAKTPEEAKKKQKEFNEALERRRKELEAKYR